MEHCLAQSKHIGMLLIVTIARVFGLKLIKKVYCGWLFPTESYPNAAELASRKTGVHAGSKNSFSPPLPDTLSPHCCGQRCLVICHTGWKVGHQNTVGIELSGRKFPLADLVGHENPDRQKILP